MNSGHQALGFRLGSLLLGVVFHAVVVVVTYLGVLQTRFAYEMLFPGKDLPWPTPIANEPVWPFAGALGAFIACKASRRLRPYAMWGLVLLDLIIVLFVLWGLSLPFAFVYTRLEP